MCLTASRQVAGITKRCTPSHTCHGPFRCEASKLGSELRAGPGFQESQGVRSRWPLETVPWLLPSSSYEEPHPWLSRMGLTSAEAPWATGIVAGVATCTSAVAASGREGGRRAWDTPQGGGAPALHTPGCRFFPEHLDKLDGFKRVRQMC